MAQLANAEGTERLSAFAEVLRRGEIELSSTSGTLQKHLGIPQARLRLYRECLASATNLAELVLVLETAAETLTQSIADHPLVEAAWTYPGRRTPGLRTTGGVSQEIIELSRRTLLVVGYSITADPAHSGLAERIVAAIAQAGERGVVVTAVLHRKVNRDALLHAWRPGVPQPALFTWSQTDDKLASIHAKVLIADEWDGLITSANLTYHGYERNLEMGLRVRGPAVAAIHRRIQDLVAAGDLISWRE